MATASQLITPATVLMPRCDFTSGSKVLPASANFANTLLLLLGGRGLRRGLPGTRHLGLHLRRVPTRNFFFLA